MADFGGEADDGTGEGQTAGQDLAVRRGLLSPSGFSSILPGASLAPRGPTLPFPADAAAARGYPGIGTTENGGPTFAGTTYLYPVGEGQLNVVELPLTGSRRQGVKAANAMAGFARTPKNYTWHHVDDFNPATGIGSLELVEKDAHKATNPHSGSVAQYQALFGTPYKR